MSVDLASEFAVQIHRLMRETFEQPEGIFLDPDMALLPTLKKLSAEQASIPLNGTCASLAAKVAHTIFFIESFERFALENDDSPRDWKHIWNTVEKVTPEEWAEMQAKLEEAYKRMDKLFQENTLWDGDRMDGALSIVVHTAYHLGEIRQALCQLT